MDLFSGVLPFTAVAEELSFRRAGRRLGITAAAVSKAVGRLEEELGVKLLHRTSRTVTLTPEGEDFLAHAQSAVAHVRDARAHASRAQREAAGTVTLTLPFLLGRRVVPELGALTERWPGLGFRLHFTDRVSQLAGEGIDVAVRIGELPDSSLRSRLLMRTRWVTLAAPAWLDRHGRPETPAELARHDCLKFLTPDGLERDFSFRDPATGATFQERVSGRVVLDRGDLLLDAAAAGLGVCQVLDFMVCEAGTRGRLEKVLADFTADGPPIHALCLPGAHATPKVRVVLDFLAELFAEPARPPEAAP